MSYSYDSDGNMVSASSPKASVTYQYDERSLPRSLSRTNGVVTNYTFDALGQVLSIIHTAAGAAINSQTYAYDAVGNRTTISNDISQALSTQMASATVDNANDLLSFGSTTYMPDANGNRQTEVTPAGATTYAWDGRNRLKTITDASGNTTTLQYDFTRNLLTFGRTLGSTSTRQTFVLDSLTNVASLTDSSGSPVSVLSGRDTDSHFGSIDAAGNSLFGLDDALGGITAISDGSGVIQEKNFYEPYGSTSGQPPTSYPFAFSGRIPISADLEYYRNRYYDPSSGRFISEDPIGILGGPNSYAYAWDDPLTFSDPLGLGPDENDAIKCAKGVYDIAKHIRSTAKDISEAPKTARNGWRAIGTGRNIWLLRGTIWFGVGTVEDGTFIGAIIGVPTQVVGGGLMLWGAYQEYKAFKAISDPVKNLIDTGNACANAIKKKCDNFGNDFGDPNPSVPTNPIS